MTKPAGRVLLIAYGAPANSSSSIFHGRPGSRRPGFPGLPDDPPPLEFQVSNPEVPHRRLSDAGLKEVRIERTAEKSAFSSGQQMWDWVFHGNPIPGMLVADLDEEQRTTIRQVLVGMLREHSGGTDPPC